MLKNYLKIAFKVFLRRKFFTFISLFGIGFTLAVLIVATSFLDHFFGPFPPEVKLDRTLFVFRIIPEYRPGDQSLFCRRVSSSAPSRGEGLHLRNRNRPYYAFQ